MPRHAAGANIGSVTPRLATKAFQRVLTRKQTRHGDVLDWLDRGVGEGMSLSKRELSRLERVVDEGDRVFEGYRY